MGAAGAVQQTEDAFRAEPGHPSVCALPRDSQLLGDMRHRPAIVKDTTNQQEPPMRRQTGVSVRHEDLRLLVKTSDISTKHRRSSPDQRLRVTNVLAEYT